MRALVEVAAERLVVVAADDAGALHRELADLAVGGDAGLSAPVSAVPAAAAGQLRAVSPARTTAELRRGAAVLASWLGESPNPRSDGRRGLHLARVADRPTVGLLFPGQGSPLHTSGGVLAARLPAVARLYRASSLTTETEAPDTAAAQPAIVTASLAGRLLLSALGVEGDIAVGHSLGERSALAWAGAVDDGDVVGLARSRGSIMSAFGVPGAAMAGVGAAAEVVLTALRRCPPPARVWVACRNAPEQTVVAGELAAVDELVARLAADGVTATRLPVSHAFHTPLVAAATEPWRARLDVVAVRAPVRRMISTVTAAPVLPGDDVRALLAAQLTEPVLFADALQAAAEGVDVWIEVGPGKVLGGLARRCLAAPVASLDAGADSWRGVAAVVGAVIAAGLAVDTSALRDVTSMATGVAAGLSPDGGDGSVGGGLVRSGTVVRA